MNDTIKNRLDAIDAQMADLQKEQAKLREELGKTDFVPGFYITWSLDYPFERVNNNASMLVYVDTQESFNSFMARSPHSAVFTPELAARFFKNPRYDWAKIVKEYPEAKWASTDEDGRVDLWVERPAYKSRDWRASLTPVTFGGYLRVGKTPDWRDSLEARPEGM